MCGVIGYSPLKDQSWEVRRRAQEAFGALFKESTIRGKHYYGIAQPNSTGPDGYSGEFKVWRSQYASTIPSTFNSLLPAIAHTRFCQSGDWQINENNQPLLTASSALVMNGVIHMGTKEEFEAAFQVKCKVDNDGEVFLRCVEKGEDPVKFVNGISGSFAGVWMEKREDVCKMFAARNTRRPLWRCQEFGAVWLASTLDIFLRAGFESPLTPLVPGLLYRDTTHFSLIEGVKSE